MPGWRARFGAALLVFAGVIALPWPPVWQSRVALAYTAGMVALCALTYAVILRPRRDEMQAFVRNADSPSWAPLAAAGVLVIGSLAPLAYLLRTVAHELPEVKALSLVVSILGVLVAWVTLHTLFALRYAQLYFEPATGQTDRPAGGLAFPEPDLKPDYWDFLYYAFVIGMCYQTSDVSVTRWDIRRYTLLHSVLAYLYGVGLRSLLVSAVAGTF